MKTKNRKEIFTLLEEEMERKNLLIPEQRVSESTGLSEIFDSFSKVEMINDMESMLQFTAKDEEWGKASTIGDFVDVIERHI